MIEICHPKQKNKKIPMKLEKTATKNIMKFIVYDCLVIIYNEISHLLNFHLVCKTDQWLVKQQSSEII